MPLVINGRVIEELPSDSRTLFELYPTLRESARALVAQPPKLISPVGSLYVLQREFAVVTPHDKNVSLVGSEDTTTCCIVVVRHIGSGVVGLAHFDGCGVEAGVDSMVRRVEEFSSAVDGHLELHLIGGFIDARGYSQELVLQLLLSFQRQLINVHLVTACVCELNNSLRGNINWPVVYGIAINVKTGDIFPASFPDKGPEIPLRSTRLFSGVHEVLDIYDTQMGLIKVGPFNYEPMRGVDLWLSQSDDFILQHLSTSPEVEPPNFVHEVRRALAFIQENPFPGVTVFPSNQSHYYRKDETGQWVPICYGNEYF